MWISERMVRMQMSDKHNVESCNIETPDSIFLKSGVSPPHDPRTTIHEIGAIIHHHSNGSPERSGSERVYSGGLRLVSAFRMKRGSLRRTRGCKYKCK